MSQLERIICHGNRAALTGFDRSVRSMLEEPNNITTADGFTVSVIAGEGTYCDPRPGMSPLGNVPAEYRGPYTEVEVGFPSERPEPWAEWKPYAEDEERPTDTVYGYVPVNLVRALIKAHGGEE